MEKWDDIFSAAKQPTTEEEPAIASPAPEATTPPAALPSSTPWADLEPAAKEPTVRLNVDIPISLNDLLAAKARKLRKPKTELVRRLLEWALDESLE
ncbi:hypothetical protein [Phormidium sp. FACHB-1136]|uniref:hypothetical protein n=1 Tax=Phormidium sp. FACHB-1136 TaxID=2692848 RepID=UPI001689727C|nr:hypothetical protein [Phormidium sp. FACHB-1136]MBD2425578.1 hypothetical protein [Phormidium sp. FACHB-1136]